MQDTYAQLASVYDRIGLGDFASSMTQRLLNFAQQNDWIGRRILDLGTGTGTCALFFANKGYNVIGVESSEAMIAAAQQRFEAQSVGINLVTADARSVEGVGPVDMVIALNMVNELDGVRDLEAVFTRAHANLSPNRMFIFDLMTIEGLTRDGLEGDSIIVDTDELVAFRSTRFDFERQSFSASYDVFVNDSANGSYTRLQGERILKAFPVQAVATLLKRQKFEILAVLDTQMRPFDMNAAGASRVIFFARNV